MTIYYVDGVSGSDGAAGGTGTPWKTLGKALATAGSGDTVRVRTATYYEQLGVNTTNLTFEADSGHTPTLDGRYSAALFGAAGYTDKSGKQIGANQLPYVNKSLGAGPANATRGNWVVNHDQTGLVELKASGAKVRGFVIRNSAGRICVLTGNNTVMENCTCDFSYGGSVGFGTTTSNARVSNCIFTRGSIKYYDPTREGAGPSKVQTSVIIKGSNNIVEGCTVAYCYGEGISADKGSKDIIIRYNTIHTNAHWGLGFNHADGAKIIGNVSYWCDNLAGEMDKSGPGDLFVGGSENAQCDPPENLSDALMTDVQVVNNLFIGGKRSFLLGGPSRPATLIRGYLAYNTFVGRGGSDDANFFLWQSMTCQGHTQTVVENNIFWAGPGRKLKMQNVGTVTFRNNLTNFAPPANFAANVRADSNVMVNPLPATIQGTYNHKSTALPSVVTTFNPAHYDLTGASAAVGRASDRSSVYGWTHPAITTDRYKAARTDYNLAQGRYYDIGAVEYGGVAPPADPTVTAAFSMNPAATSIITGSAITFTDQSYADNCNITGRTWTVKLGATTVHTATTNNLSNYTFNTAGTWTVFLSVTTDAAGVSDTESVAITVSPPTSDPTVTASFSRSPSATTVNQNTTIQFTNTSTVTNTTKTGQTWEVRTSPGNTLVTSATTNNFTWQFTTAGVFVVKLTVDTAAGVSDTEQVTITVNAVVTPTVSAGFTLSTGPVVDEGTAITFTNTSTAVNTTITGYTWTITNGSVVSTYTTTNVTHTFSQAGTWLVSLLAETAAGVSGDASETITVRSVSSGGAGLYKSMIVPHRVAVNTTTGEQTITTAALGTLVPKGVTIRLTAAVTDGTAADGALWAEGATDGTAQWSLVRFSQDNAASGGAKRRYKSGVLLQTIDHTGAITGEAVFARFVAGGVVINVTDAFPAAYLAEIDFYAGDDMRVAAGTAVLSTVGSTVAVTTGIDQDFVYFATSWAADGGGAVAEAGLSMGWAVANGAQAAVRNQDKDASNPSSVSARYSDKYCAISADGTPGVLVNVEAGGWTATGFTLLVKNNSLDARPLGWFAVDMGGPAVSLSVATLATASTSVHATPFEAQAVLGVLTAAAGAGPSYNDANAEGIGYYATSIYDSGAEYTTWITAADNAATYNTKSLTDNAFRGIAPDGTNKWNGTRTLNAGDITFGFTTNPAAAYLIILLAVEQSEALPVTPADTPAVDFTADVQAGQTKLLVRFDSSLTNDNGSAITAWLWDFGDGLTSTAANPSHIYKAEGEFTVSLTATNANGSTTVVREAYIITTHPVKRRTLVGPIRSLPARFDSTTAIDLDYPDDSDRDDEFGFHTHPVGRLDHLRLTVLTASQIADLAAGHDGDGVLVVWNGDTNEITVVLADGTIRKAATT